MHAFRAFHALLGILVVLAISLAGRTSFADEAIKPDLGTPRRAVASFVEAAEEGDFERASFSVDLTNVPANQRIETTRKLFVVLERVTWVDLGQLSDDPKGKPEDGDTTEIVATAKMGSYDAPISLTRSPGGEWRFNAPTVARVPKLYELHGPRALEQRIPPVLRGTKAWGLEPWQWLGLPVAVVLALLVAAVFSHASGKLMRRLAARTVTTVDDELVTELHSPSRFFFSTLLLRAFIAPLSLDAAATHVVSRVIGTATIATVAWIAIATMRVLARWVEQRARDAASDAEDRDLRARGIATQVRLLRRVVNVAICIVAIALMLTQFEIVRNVGVSLLASAGLAGVVLGLAAQRTLAGLIAGIQLSVTQPIRIGDAVVVEKEFGTIEEITLTYVVVRLWDERRLIVPMTRFLEQPFENWTKNSAQLHGTVFLEVDYELPIAAVRKELDAILESHPDWDGRTRKVSVTDAKDRTMQVRVLVSAQDASRLWDLRADVRERLVHWLKGAEDGRYLPRLRYEDQ